MNVKQIGFVMMFLIGTAYADNQIYIDQVGAAAVIEVIQDGSGNKVGGSVTDDTKMLLSGDNMDFNVNLSGGSNNVIGSVIGTSTVDIDVDGSTNNIGFDVDKDNVYGATDGNYVINVTGGNNDLDIDVASLDTANDVDFDFVLTGDFNEADVNIDASSLTFDLDVAGDNNSLLYNASGYDGHEFILTGTGSYWDVFVNQESTLQSDTLEIDYDGSGTSDTSSTLCITQSDSGTATGCSP
jgi:hypothetical protein